MTYANGDHYDGEWEDHQRHGQGAMTYANGDKYEGEWKDDKKHGQGSQTFKDGWEYVGEFRNGKWHKGETLRPEETRKPLEYQNPKPRPPGSHTDILIG